MTKSLAVRTREKSETAQLSQTAAHVAEQSADAAPAYHDAEEQKEAPEAEVVPAGQFEHGELPLVADCPALAR